MRWFIKNWPTISFVLRLISMVIPILAPTSAAYLKMPFPYWVISFGAGLAVACASCYYLLKLGDYFESKGEGAEEGERIAKILEGLLLGGRNDIDARSVVRIWFEDQPQGRDDPLRQAVKAGMYARLAEGVRRGWLQCPNHPAELVRSNYLIDIKDLIGFFRNRMWLRILPG